MKGYNVIVVFNETEDAVLMCRRRRDPFQGLLNFVGGKIETDEDGSCAAYRELEEETGITVGDILLTHLTDFTYYLDDFYMEVYVGRLNKSVNVFGDENDLYWIDPNQNFFDTTQYAGLGNVGHIMKLIMCSRDVLLR